MKLVIIEGAGKKETIEKYLGSGYKVFATKGHIRDLPPSPISVNVKNNFEPTYKVMEDKIEIASKLKEAAQKASSVLLATDPDREGEAISWHVAHMIDADLKAPIRIVFNEISKKAIQAALENPRPIDQNLVDAQQARRVLDRLVGYKVSPVLCRKIQNKLSAGRVQSVTLKLVVDREREIRAFIPEEYWPFFSMLKKGTNPLKAALEKKDGKKFKLTCKEEVDDAVSHLNGKEYKVTSVKKSVTKSKPLPPFITSSLQQDAMNKLGLSLKQTSATAQTLYEGVELGNEGKVALVTYIRTDSTRVAPEVIAGARKFIENKFGADYIPEKPNFYASKKGAQDAHEAIRPISIERTPESLKGMLQPAQLKLYTLIYNRFLASQMSEATFNSMAVEIGCGDYGFKVNGKTPLFAGHTIVYNAADKKDSGDEDDAEKDDANTKLPDLSEGDILDFIEYKFEQKFTKPPARYTDASLVKAMEEKGIGRPATYVPTISILTARAYCEKEGKYLKPTELGEKVTDMLVKYFVDIMDIKFTARMEDDLDKIEDGGVVWQSVIADFYAGFEDKIKAAMGDEYTLKEPPIPTDVECDKCGTMMVIRTGRFGQFLACPAFPKCRNIKQMAQSANPVANGGAFDDGSFSLAELSKNQEKQQGASKSPLAPISVQVVDDKGEPCEKCGKVMLLKQGKFGPFYACPGYPDCKNIKTVEKEGEQKDSVPAGTCPKCSKSMKKINFRGKVFYGCSDYPTCKFSVNNPVLDGKCPTCDSYLLRKELKDGVYAACGEKACKYKDKIADN